MLENYFNVTFRTLWKNKIYSVITITGLTIGLAVCFLIYIYESSEKSYNDLHPQILANSYFLSLIGMFILVITCINFINLSTARNMERAKEVGVRKLIGAGQFQLAKQFMAESAIICMIAFAFTILLSSLFLPLLNQLAGKQVSVNILSKPIQVARLFALVMTVAFISGLYPSLELASYKPVNILKGRFMSRARGSLVRRALVIFQFTISIMMIIGAIIFYAQFYLVRYNAAITNFNTAPTVDVWHNSRSIPEQFYDSYYDGGHSIVSVVLILAILTTFNSCLGLLALTSYNTLRRANEIGVRKVLGASVASIVSLLSGDLIKLVVLAFFIAVPAGWYAMYQWLKGFTYQVDLRWWIFLTAGVVAVMVALITVSLQAVKAARSNPAKNLRVE